MGKKKKKNEKANCKQAGSDCLQIDIFHVARVKKKINSYEY